MPKSQIDIDDLAANDDDGKKENAQRKSRPSSTSSRTSAAQEKELKTRLQACFDRIAESLTERGDEELAELVREDAPVMAQGLVSLSRPFKAVRTPLLAFVAIIEPLLAFGRVIRVLVARWQGRRYARAMEAQAAAEAEAVAAQ